MYRKTAGIFLIALMFAVTQAQENNDQQDKPLRLKASLVEIRAVVTDRSGKPVAGLKKEDFELSENGRPQSINFFSVDQIGKVVSSQPSPSGEKASDASGPSTSGGRAIVLFVDTLHTSSPGMVQLKQALRKFVDEQMTDFDRVALVNSAGGMGLMWQFTSDRRALRYAIERLVPWPGLAVKESFFTPYLAAEIARDNEEAVSLGSQIVKAEDGYKITALGGMDPDGPAKRFARTRAKEILLQTEQKRRLSLTSLKAASEMISQMPGQRLMFYLSEGFSMRDMGGNLDSGDVRTAISRAVRSGVIIYSIDVKGLRISPLFDAASGDIGGSSITTSLSRYTSFAVQELQDGMNALARDTGGEALFNSNNLNLTMGKALDENRISYLLAYYPSDEQSKGFRRIALKVKNHPEYNVRAQRGYLPVNSDAGVTATTPKEKLAQAMLSPAPQTAIRVSATAGFLASESDDAQVTWQVHLDGSNLEYRDEGGRYQIGFEVATGIYDLSGKLVRNFAETIKAGLLPERMKLGRTNGYDYAKRVPLDPGLYQFRAGVLEPSTGRIGTATAWVEVPDLSRRRMVLSDIFLRDDLNKTDTATGNGNDIYAASGIKSYKQKNALVYQLVVYNAPPAEELSIQMEIFSAGQKAYQMAWRPVAAYIVKKGEKTISLGGQFQADLPPGVYELNISVRDAGSKSTSQRSIPFAIE